MKRILLLCCILMSCKSYQPSVGIYEKEYVLLNSLMTTLVDANKEAGAKPTIYLRKDASNGHFSSILERNFKKYFHEEDFDLIFKQGDLDFMKKQLDEPFIIDFSKIKSRKIKPYFSKLTPSSSLQTRSNRSQRFSEANVNYAVSRPVFTQNQQWAMVYVLNETGISVDILKMEEDQWEFYRMIPIGIF